MDYTNLKVSDFGEKSLIKLIIKLSKEFQDIDFLLGDDAAILKINNTNLIASTDMLIQSQHFPKEMTYEQIGFKSVTVNVSDLAAMGSSPLGFLLSIAIPKETLLKDFIELIKGVLNACKYYNIPLVGGDTNEAGEIIISGTALGTSNSLPLKKSTFKTNDLICITNSIGLAGLGFYLLNKNIALELSKIAISKILKPIARIKEGKILKDYASSATDITDGLASELYEILNNNENNGILIYEEKLNISDEYKNLAKKCNKDYLDLVLNFGEDFELLFTISEENSIKLKNKLDFNIIGEINNSDKIEIKKINGKIEKIPQKGYEHLS
ncbi:thiamine-phosphate kinase [Methanobrevibacter sp. DSM 116169]|uniref:thiamine-phosphate kinase n=1 Tax=Methanobrevibacter sp. DSM 116169 TaxID=3242727 RepID=UPI0038FC9D9A